MTIIDQAKAHLRTLSPHVRERLTAKLLEQVLAELNQVTTQRDRTAELLREFCKTISALAVLEERLEYKRAEAQKTAKYELQQVVFNLLSAPDNLSAIKEAAGLFRQYEAHHQAKGHTEKADVNRMAAESLEALFSEGYGNES